MCKSVDGQYPRAMLPNPQGTLSTFEVGIALLTAVELERERQCGQCILACMPCPYYITLRRAHDLDSEFAKLFQ